MMAFLCKLIKSEEFFLDTFEILSNFWFRHTYDLIGGLFLGKLSA